MNPTLRDLKRNAREILNGKYSILIFAYLLIELISTTLTGLFTPSNENISLRQEILYDAAVFLISLVLMVFMAGLTRIVMNLIRREEVHPRLVLFAFKSQADRFFIAAFLKMLCFILPLLIPYAFSYYVGTLAEAPAFYYILEAVLYLAGCVVAILLLLRFEFVMQILLDDVYCGAIEAFKRSSSLMKGNCLRLFGLYLSFIGWFLLGLLSFGIGFLWILPYFMTVENYFYFSLTGELTPHPSDSQTGSQNGDSAEGSFSSQDQSNDSSAHPFA